jgi:uncharacterized protein (TIGR00299 family) protein
MRVGILHLTSGISGDMFLGALVDAGAPLDAMRDAVRAVGGERLDLRASEVTRAGLRGVKVDVLLDGAPVHETGGPVETASHAHDPAHEHAHDPAHEHAHGPAHDHHAGAHGRSGGGHDHPVHRPYSEIVSLLDRAPLDPSVRDGARRVFARLADVEGRLHGRPPDVVEFHEVGSLDAIADVVGTVAGLRALGLDRLYHGPVSVGGGTAHAAHGALPIPAPATLDLLEGRACLFEEGAGELTTPTGAALLAVHAAPLPPELVVRPERAGYGAGGKDPAGRPNLARLVIGESLAPAAPRARVAVIEAALDDCTPEDAGHLLRSLLDAGALDATLTPMIMKKGRPGFLLRVLSSPESVEDFAARVVRESSSLGARWRIEQRLELARRIDTVRFEDGEVRVKVAILPDGGERPHAEYEDLSALALRRGIPVAELRREVERRWSEGS